MPRSELSKDLSTNESRSYDALLPPEMARKASEIGVNKAAMDALTTFSLAVLAGAFIALGAVVAKGVRRDRRTDIGRRSVAAV